MVREPNGFALVFLREWRRQHHQPFPPFGALLPNLISTLGGVVMIVFGDVSLGSTIGDRNGVEIRTSTARLMDTDQVLYRGRQLMSGEAATARPMAGGGRVNSRQNVHRRPAAQSHARFRT